MTTKKIVVNGTLRAMSVAERLVYKSKWFTCTPLPDDDFEFVVKDEAGLGDVFR